jgi:hypothetical protein
MEIERPEIVELFYAALFSLEEAERLFAFVGPKVQWILSAADPNTLGEDLPSNALKFSGPEGFAELALYFRDRLRMISADLTGCIPHHHLVFSYGRVYLQRPGTAEAAETTVATKFTFQGLKITKCQIRIAWPLAF